MRTEEECFQFYHWRMAAKNALKVWMLELQQSGTQKDRLKAIRIDKFLQRWTLPSK